MPQHGDRRRDGGATDHGTEHASVVVVGSGFGGSVAAYRFASAGHEVVLLERGKPYPPGDFPRTPAEMAANFWDPSEGLHGMFDVWAFTGLDGVVCSGLGGGSLIYANVLLRKDERWFVHESPLPGGGYEHWPVSRADLDPSYAAVERMLSPTRYPYDDTPKTTAMHHAADRLNLRCERPPLAVSFAPAAGQPPVPGAVLPIAGYGNVHGAPRRTCRLCGECDIGCNDGAKNSLDHTYLSAAKHHGADLRTRCEVRGIAPRPGGGYRVSYVIHESDREGRRTSTDRLPPRTITCDRLVLGAGTFGTTYLLLRNRAAFPGMSRTLGTRFCGNGDLLTFLLDAKLSRDGQGHQGVRGSRGPVITSAIRVADGHDGAGTGDRGYYIQDAGFPVFVEWLLEAAAVPGTLGRAARFARTRLRSLLGGSPRPEISATVSALLGSGATGGGFLPLLGMGRDVPDGVMRLRKGYLDVQWTTKTSEEYFSRVRASMRDIAGELDAKYVDNPLWWTKRVITVHPLGGAPMGRHVAEGTCDEYGEVFGFPGLHVLDGALLPGPVGANPSLTIAALADRACDRILGAATARRYPGSAAREEATERPRTPERVYAARRPEATSVSFTEEMKGFLALDVAEPEQGAALGRMLDQRLMFHLSITTDDIDRFVADPAHEGRAEGYVECDALGGRLSVARGWFNLFTRDDDATRRRMTYRLHLLDSGGNALTFVGHKDVHDDAGADVWRDTSTLYVQVFAGHLAPGEVTAGPPVASGVITIHIPDFLRQLASFRTEGPDPVRAVQRFGHLFLGELWKVYGPSLAAVGSDR